MPFHLQWGARDGTQVHNGTVHYHAALVCVWARRRLGYTGQWCSVFKQRTDTLGTIYFTICSIYAWDSCLLPWSNCATVMSSVTLQRSRGGGDRIWPASVVDTLKLRESSLQIMQESSLIAHQTCFILWRNLTSESERNTKQWININKMLAVFFCFFF